MTMKTRSNKLHKRKSWVLILLLLAIGLFIGWLLLLLFWTYFFPTTTEDETSKKTPIQGIIKQLPKFMQDWELLNFAGEETLDGSKGKSKTSPLDGHGFTPTMDELLAERPFDNETFDARFDSVKRPSIPESKLSHSTFGRKVAFVYHSHSRESFLPYFPETDDPKEAYHESRNITQVGQMLEQALENQGIGTLLDTSDIIKELEKPGLDIREQAKVFTFNQNISSIADLETGQLLPGIVNNVTNFGAFVDVGIKESGLIHVSNLADTFVSDVNEYVSLHQQVIVKVLDVDIPRKRIQLKLHKA